MLDILPKDSIWTEQSLPEIDIPDVDINQKTIEKLKTEKLFEGMELSEQMFNIMLVGTDTRSNDFEGRTDSMILISINPDTNKIILCSFLRDLYVNIPGYGGDRLNAAYVYGGTSLLAETFYYNFGIEIDKFVVINFWQAIDLLDDLGGTEIAITAEEIEVMNYYLSEQNRILEKPEGTDYLTANDAGTRLLNGNQALAFARIRYIGTDFARTSRQRQIITICIEKLKQMSILEINDLLEKYLPRIQTNLTEGEVMTLLFMALQINDYNIESMVIPMDYTWDFAQIDGMSVIQADLLENAEAWYEKVK